MMLFLIWSIEHDAWWRPRRSGYTRVVWLAGRYDDDEAREIVQTANVRTVNECAIPVGCVGLDDGTHDERVRQATDTLALVRRTTDDEQRDAIRQWARDAVARGAGHDCDEWRDATGACALCGAGA